MHGNHTVDIETLLPYVPLFKGLESEQLARITAGTREIRAAKDDILFAKGDTGDGFYLIIHGQIKLVFTSAEGDEKVVEIFGQGQTFGEDLMLEEKPHVVSAQALSDSLLLHFSKAVIFQELEQDPALRLKMLARMSMRLHEILSDVESYSLLSGRQRLIGYLLQHLPKDAPAKDAVLTLAASKANIASRLNVTQEHFSRILNELSNAGLISVQRDKILIPDLEELRKHS